MEASLQLGFIYNGVQYFYITNQLGDILTITDSSGDAFVMYSYDEWGQIYFPGSFSYIDNSTRLH